MNIDQINTVAIIGAGTMGSGISLCVAAAGYQANLYDVSDRQLEKALARVQSSQEVLIREGSLSHEQARQSLARIHYYTDLGDAVAQAQFIIEAVPEELELKRRVFRQIEETCPPDAVRVTNTSGLSVSDITRESLRPGLSAGMHWVNPPELVPLVEIIRGEKSSDETIGLIYELAVKLGKKPVLIQKEVPGIGLNRLQFALFREALGMVEEGVVSAEDVDRIMCYGLGFRYPWIGPLKTADLGGLDVFYEISKYLFQHLSDAKTPPPMLAELITAGHLGVKSGQGFYDYGQDAAGRILDRRDRSFIRQCRLMQEIDSEG